MVHSIYFGKFVRIQFERSNIFQWSLLRVCSVRNFYSPNGYFIGNYFIEGIYNQISLWVFISVVHSFNELFVHAFIYFFHFVVIIIYNYHKYFSRYLLINMEYSIQQLHILFSVSLKYLDWIVIYQVFLPETFRVPFVGLYRLGGRGIPSFELPL